MIKNPLDSSYIFRRILNVVLLIIIFGLTSAMILPSDDLNFSPDIKDCVLDSLLLADDFDSDCGDTIQLSCKDYRDKPIDIKLRKLIGLGDHNKCYVYSLVELSNDLIGLSVVEDEMETLSIVFYTIKDCKVLDKLLIAETSTWEHGHKETKSFIKSDSQISMIKFQKSKDWGDYTKWSYDTIYSSYIINDKGLIVESDY